MFPYRLTMGPTSADRLAEAVETAALADRLQRQLDQAREHVLVSAREREQATARLEAEQRDVEQLRGLSWSGVLARMKGSKDDDLRRAEAEADDARVAAVRAEQRHAQDAGRVESLRHRIRELGSTTQALERARADHEAWLAEHDTARGPRLRELAESDGALAAEQQELREALDAGREAQARLEAALEKLHSADNWAAWDTFGGGGLLTDTIKYDRLREVGDELERAGHALRRFDAELADVHLGAVEAIEVDQWDRTFDVWFDNVFSDWKVSRRIDDAVRRTREALTRVRDTGQALEAREREVTASRTVIADERVHLLER